MTDQLEAARRELHAAMAVARSSLARLRNGPEPDLTAAAELSLLDQQAPRDDR